ncbi:MAG: SRPBCC family protein [Archangium sp.]
MVVSACPTDVVEAPVEGVWSFLTSPDRLDLWWDAKVARVSPPGPMVAGQRIDASTRAFGRSFPVRFDVHQVDAEQHQVRMTAYLPLGLINDTTLTCSPLQGGRCRVTFS